MAHNSLPPNPPPSPNHRGRHSCPPHLRPDSPAPGGAAPHPQSSVPHPPPSPLVQARILEVLLSIPDRDQRAALLPDAFNPPSSASSGYGPGVEAMGSAGLGEGVEGDEEQLYTTPLRLLQAVDLLAARLEGAGSSSSSGGGGGSSSPWQQQQQPCALLPGGVAGLGGREVRQALAELRADVLAYWEQAMADSF